MIVRVNKNTLIQALERTETEFVVINVGDTISGLTVENDPQPQEVPDVPRDRLGF